MIFFNKVDKKTGESMADINKDLSYDMARRHKKICLKEYNEYMGLHHPDAREYITKEAHERIWGECYDEKVELEEKVEKLEEYVKKLRKNEKTNKYIL